MFCGKQTRKIKNTMNGIITNAAAESKPQTEVNTGLKAEKKSPKEIKGFTKADNRLFWQGRYLTTNAKWIHVTLQSFENSETGATFPSYDAIVARTNLRREKIAEGLRELERFCWITKRKKFSKSTHYYVTHPVRYEDKVQTILMADQTYPTKEQTVTWAKKIRDEQKAKDAKRAKKRGWMEAQEAIKRKREETGKCKYCGGDGDCGDDDYCNDCIPF